MSPPRRRTLQHSANWRRCGGCSKDPKITSETCQWAGEIEVLYYQSVFKGGWSFDKETKSERRKIILNNRQYSEKAIPKALKARPVVLRRRATSKTKSIYDLSSEDEFDEALESRSFVRRRATRSFVRRRATLETKSIYDMSSEDETEEALKFRSFVRKRAPPKSNAWLQFSSSDELGPEAPNPKFIIRKNPSKPIHYVVGFGSLQELMDSKLFKSSRD